MEGPDAGPDADADAVNPGDADAVNPGDADVDADAPAKLDISAEADNNHPTIVATGIPNSDRHTHVPAPFQLLLPMAS